MRPRFRRRTRLAPADVAAVLVTRGDVDLTRIIESLPYGEVVVWDNSKRPQNLIVYGRYAGIADTKAPFIYVQDDDCLIRCHNELMRHAERGAIVANMPRERWDHYRHSTLVGWGALFERDLPLRAFDRYKKSPAYDEKLFLRECDLVFAALTRCRKYDFGLDHLAHARGGGRLYQEPGHSERRAALVEDLRDLQANEFPLRSYFRARKLLGRVREQAREIVTGAGSRAA